MPELGEELPEEPCLICREDARAKLAPEVRAIVEELIADQPHDRVPELGCWNCLGRGTVHGPRPTTIDDYLEKFKGSKNG